jgi:CBS domain-containing protein
MTTAKDIMTPGAQSIPRTGTLDRAAQMMRDHELGALPFCDPSNHDRMCGIITDRDIVVKCIAEGHDPTQLTCGDLCEGTPRWIDAASDVSDVLREMENHRIKRLPVIEDSRMIGMISEADMARHLTDDQLAEFVHRVYAG